MYKILIIEDDLVIANSLKNHLCKWEFEIAIVADFKRVLEEFIQFDPQVVLMDISLPYFNGYHWCSEIRKLSKVPIVFISSSNENMNIVMAMNMGGDDFIAKPFDLTVVVAKIQAMIRRTYSFQGQINVIEHNGVMLNISDASLTYQNEKVNLTKNEFRILQILLEHTNNVVSRDAIMERLWESESFIDDNTLTVNVTRLRKKIEDIGLEKFILTKKGIGYMVT
ncbi:MAG: DNA-binding response regulator [Firmicutes bacterium HGW-Firmicutes-1]|jgi:DNA-binding response OmpR family regulator|nr:MAG: DNA-binding response regulator [Firmicutes bacterium HGW-Firmicutes-1]